VIVGGGPEHDPQQFASLLKDSVVIAADGGWRHCRTVGITAKLLVGDMDTLTPTEIAQAQSMGTEVRRFPSDKDQSDLELAILAAHQMGARRITLLGALGGQWDHCLANLLAPLSLCQSLGVWARLLTQGAEIYLLGPGAYILRDQVGSRASLAALSPQASGLSLDGFRYNLDSGALTRQQTLGLANAVTRPEATVSLGSGELLLTLVRTGS
jgi:thiamine pyrophosphokinase